MDHTTYHLNRGNEYIYFQLLCDCSYCAITAAAALLRVALSIGPPKPLYVIHTYIYIYRFPTRARELDYGRPYSRWCVINTSIEVQAICDDESIDGFSTLRSGYYFPSIDFLWRADWEGLRTISIASMNHGSDRFLHHLPPYIAKYLGGDGSVMKNAFRLVAGLTLMSSFW